MDKSYESEAKDVMGHHEAALYRCYQNALEKLNIIMSQVPQLWYARAKATMLHNIVNNEARAMFEAAPDVTITEQYETITVIFGGKVAARFKKVNEEGFSSNIPTQRNQRYVQGELGFDEPGYNTLTTVEIGYVPDTTWSSFVSVDIIGRNDDTILWSYAIHNSSNTDTTGTTSIRPTDDTPLIPLVTIKKTAEQ